MSRSRLSWQGDQTLSAIQQALAGAIVEIDLRIESQAKRNLRPSLRDERGRWVKGGGRGLRTGTLRRSLHAASPDYHWAADNVPPGQGSTERGGREYAPRITRSRVTGCVGSGLVYALALHQSDDSEGKHYLIRAYDEVRPLAPEIVRRHAMKRRAR